DRRIPIAPATGRPTHGEDVRLEWPQPANLRFIQRAGQGDESTGFPGPIDPRSPRRVDRGPPRLGPGIEEDSPAIVHLGGFIDDRPRLGGPRRLPVEIDDGHPGRGDVRVRGVRSFLDSPAKLAPTLAPRRAGVRQAEFAVTDALPVDRPRDRTP